MASPAPGSLGHPPLALALLRVPQPSRQHSPRWPACHAHSTQAETFGDPAASRSLGRERPCARRRPSRASVPARLPVRPRNRRQSRATRWGRAGPDLSVSVFRSPASSPSFFLSRKTPT